MEGHVHRLTMGTVLLQTQLEHSSLGEDAWTNLNSNNGIAGDTRGMYFSLIDY